MAYYDVYDSNDTLIASDVWIDDGPSGGRPIVIDFRKLLMIFMAFVGFANTFVLPIILFFNRSSFIEGGWLIATIPSLIIGLPLFIVFIKMLATLNSVKKNEDLDEEVLHQAEKYLDRKHLSRGSRYDDDSLSDAEYVKGVDKANRFDAALSAVYLAIKWESLINKVAYTSYLVYPIGILLLVAELVYGTTESFLIILWLLNYVIVFPMVFSFYKAYKNYKQRGAEGILKRMISVAFVAIIIGILVSVVCVLTLNIGGYTLLCVVAALLELSLSIDSKKASNNVTKKTKIKVVAIIIITIVYSLLATLVGCAIALVPGEVNDAILAYDAGLSTDLSLPITVWSICAAVAIALIVVTSILIHKGKPAKEKDLE